MDRLLGRAQLITTAPKAQLKKVSRRHLTRWLRINQKQDRLGLEQNPAQLEGFEMEATPPATPRHTMFPLWLLPSGSDQVHG